MRKVLKIITLFFLPVFISAGERGVREVSKTSCDVIPVKLGLGMTTQIVLEQKPKVTLYADKKHFKIHTNKESPRSLAIIPFVESSELDALKDSKGQLPNSKKLASALNENFKTNLFVFFENNNQLMFDLRFVQKEKADYVLKVKQIFNQDCTL